MARCYNCMQPFSDGYDVCPYCGYMHNSANQQYYLPAGTILENGRYFIGLPVNAGGFGIVYKAWDLTLDKLMAIKEYFPGGIVTRQPGTAEVRVYSEKNRDRFLAGKNRFLIEARVISKYRDHPSIVDVYDFFEANHTAYMVMEYMEGLTYKNYIERVGGSVEEQLAINVTLALLDALREIHKDHIVHRDINPSNVFICGSGTVKLFDFGAAKIEGTPLPDTLTRGYAPPEQYSTTKEQGVVTDIYSVGATMYYALTGVKPEEATDREEKDKVKSPHQLNPQISKNISNAVMRAMALKPALRFQTVNEFRDVLLKGKHVLDVDEEIKRRKRKRFIIAGSMVLFFAAIGTVSAFHIKKNMEAGTLAAASLHVWVVSDADETEQDAQKRFLDMVKPFNDEFPQIELNVTVYPVEEYKHNINLAASNSSLPDVFESTYLDEQYDYMLAGLDETLSLITERSSYEYLDDFESIIPEKNRMPLCYQVPVIYVRQGSGMFAETENRITVNSESASMYAEIYGESWLEEHSYGSSVDARQEFIDGKAKRYYSDTSDYTCINELLRAQYTLEFPEKEAARFDHVWSVSIPTVGGKKEKNNKMRAGQWMIGYLLSGHAEDIMTIEYGEGIPLYKKTSEIFFDVYGGELETIRNLVPSIKNLSK